MERFEFDYDVVVVGAGAAGLAAAITLGRYGVATLLVDQRPAPSALPRATVVSTRSMELMRAWGLEDDVLEGGVDADVWLWECPTLAQAAAGTAHAVGYPTREQAATVSPCAPGTVPQDWVETVLRRHVTSLPAVRFELGTKLITLDGAPDRVAVTLLDPGGRVRIVRARYVVAADGAHSPVRRLLGVPMRGPIDGAYAGIQVVMRAPLWPMLADRRYGLYFVTTPDSPGLFLPAGRGDRWVYGPGRAPADQSADADPTRLVEAIRRGAGVHDLDVRLERIGPFHSLGQLAAQFRVGRTFLVGDAAHRVTPRGSTGMNIAIHSGHDLAWKLAWVVNGWAEPGLLDTYESERRVVAEHNVIRSTDPDGSRRPVLDELGVDLGGRVAHAWLPSTSPPVSTLDLLGAGWTLFTGPSRRTPDTMRVPSPAPVAIRVLDGVTARTLGLRGDGALLARPDGVPVALGQPPVASTRVMDVSVGSGSASGKVSSSGGAGWNSRPSAITV